MQEDVTVEMRGAVERRVLIAQALYAFGALQCVLNSCVSIAFMVLVELNCAISPRIKPVYRL